MSTKTYLLAILFAAITITGCNLIEDLIKIPIKITNEFTVPAGASAGVLLNPITGSSETNIENELNANDSRKDKIKSIELRELTLTVKTSGKDFSFVDNIDIYLNTENQPEKLIASKSNIDPNSTSFSMDVVNDDLIDYIKTDEVSFRAKFENKELDLTPTRVEVFTKFRITADIF